LKPRQHAHRHGFSHEQLRDNSFSFHRSLALSLNLPTKSTVTCRVRNGSCAQRLLQLLVHIANYRGPLLAAYNQFFFFFKPTWTANYIPNITTRNNQIFALGPNVLRSECFVRFFITISAGPRLKIKRIGFVRVDACFSPSLLVSFELPTPQATRESTSKNARLSTHPRWWHSDRPFLTPRQWYKKKMFPASHCVTFNENAAPWNSLLDISRTTDYGQQDDDISSDLWVDLAIHLTKTNVDGPLQTQQFIQKIPLGISIQVHDAISIFQTSTSPVCRYRFHVTNSI
jgi:hypothetical protein